MEKYKNIVTSAKAVVIFKNILNDTGISALVNLSGCESDNENEFLKYYSDFVSALYQKTDDLCEYINDLLLNDENIYVMQSAKGNVSPFVKNADPLGSIPMIFTSGFFSLRYFAIPDIVPPVPIPATK